MRGKKIHLRLISLEDVTERYLEWLNDPEVNRYLETRFTEQTLESIRAFVSEKISSSNEFLYAICENEGDRHIGNIKLGPLNPHHRSADVSLFIGEKNCWGKGYATEAIFLLTQHAFDSLGLNKLRAGCYASNQGSAAAFEKCGWTREGLQKGMVQSEGREMDLILLGIRASEYREYVEKGLPRV